METANYTGREREEAEERARNVEEGTDANFEPFELQPSIIDAVAKLCPENEAEEIWRVVGHSLVEQSRDLLEEARTLLEIWRQLKEDADHAASHGVSASLPEPPMVRERLIQEIRFLADHLRDKAGSPAPGSHSSDRSREILDYALTTADQNRSGHGSGCGRPQSAVSSRDGRDTPLRPGTSTPSSLDGSQSSVLSGRMSTEHVSLTNIDSSVEYLREALEEEIAQRKEDIVFLQECSEGESSHLEACSKPLPSLRELRECGTQLEREALGGTGREERVSPTGGLPRPPPLKCPGRQHTSSTGVRRASAVRPRLPSIPHNIRVQEDTSYTKTHRTCGHETLSTDHHSVGGELFGGSHRCTAVYTCSTDRSSTAGKPIT